MVGEPLMNWMRKRFTRRLLFFVFLLLLSACDDPAVKDGAAGAAALTVIVTPAEKRDVPLTIDMVGTTLGTQDVPIRARVEGFLESMDFQEGTFVSRGDLLYTIDPQPFQAKLVEAQSQLAGAQTALAKAAADLGRIRPLAEM
jgi:membrane fusion protein (multidrug efflux system)